MEFLKLYFTRHKKKVICFLLCCVIFISAFILYHLPVEAAIYPSVICLLVIALFFAFDFYASYRKHKLLSGIIDISNNIMELLPQPKGVDDADYRRIIEMMSIEHEKLARNMDMKYYDMVDYYTVWAHQIKTPIASMRLHLQNEDSPLTRKLNSDLLRIEQYVEMVLTFLRLDSDSTDYVIAEYDLDNIIRQSVRRFSDEFIGKKLKLNYEPVNTTVLTDEKWLFFIIEQVISNALKYTKSGSIDIWLEKPKTLCIRDTGIGIAPDDLPRIFDKGYTGYNGRNDKKASGIGLYLCRRIATNLNHTITATSELSKGTTIYIELDREDMVVE